MTEQIQSVASIDDFEANRAKTKKALPALLIVFTLGTLMIQAFNLVFQNIVSKCIKAMAAVWAGLRPRITVSSTRMSPMTRKLGP